VKKAEVKKAPAKAAAKAPAKAAVKARRCGIAYLKGRKREWQL